MAPSTPAARAPTMRRAREDEPVTNLSVAALGALFLANIALVILGLILIVVGRRAGGVGSVFAHGGLDDTLFENPGTSASVIGALLCALASYGLAGLYHRNKTYLMSYHVLSIFMLVGIIYACAVMNIYKSASADMVMNYWQTFQQNANITGISRVGRPTRLDHAVWIMRVAEARAEARLFLRTVASCMGASIFFILTALGCSAYIMGLKYTGVYVGIITNVAGVAFALTLFVLCYFVAKSTYNVPDAVSMKFDVAFMHDVGVSVPQEASHLFDTLRKSPDLIFQTTDPSNGRRRLLQSDGNSTQSPPLPPPPSPLLPPPPSPLPPPPPDDDWQAQSVWVFEEGHIRVDHVQYNLTFKLALAGISGDDLDESFSAWAAKKIADFGQVTPDKVYVSELKAGAEHKIGGVWAPRFLAATAFIIAFFNVYGLVAIYKDDRFLMATHFCFSFTGVLLMIIAAALVSKHADATSRLISNNWHSIQNKVIGAGVEPVDAGAFARAHFKAAAALGITVIVLQVTSIVATLFNFFSDEPSYTLLTPGKSGSNSNGATTGRFAGVELDSFDEEYGRRGSLSQDRVHTRRGSDGLVPLGNLATPPSKHFSID